MTSLPVIVPIQHHTWYGKTCHIVRNNKIVKAKIKELKLSKKGVVGFIVSFKVNGVTKNKLISPLMIACIHVLWLYVDVVSEEDEDTSMFVNEMLPLLKVEPKVNLDEDIKVILEWTVKQTVQIQNLISYNIANQVE